MSDKKNEIQRELINRLKEQFSQIMLASIRVGKCRIILTTIKEINKENPKILVLYPNVDIRKSWENECFLINYHPNITYSTYISIDKVKDEKWDFIVCDEGHLIPEENILPKLAELIKKHSNTLIASGTYNSDTLKALKEATRLKHIINYSTEQAINDGILCDFNINIHEYELDNTIKYTYGKIKQWQSTELKECNRLSNKVDNSFGQQKMFFALQRMRFINSTLSLQYHVRTWIMNNSNKRFLLFCGDGNISKVYNISMFNSKSKENTNLIEFQEGKINQLALIKKGSVGLTFPNLDCILISNIDSNAENLEQKIGRSLLLDTDKAEINIFISNQLFQKKWLNKALEGINQSKIQWLTVK